MRKSVRACVVMAVLAAGWLAPVAPAAAAPPSFREHPSSVWYATNGAVYAITSTADTVVVGGSFTRLRNRVTGRVVARNRLAAFDRSGQLLASFARGANNTIRSLETDGSRVFVGGAFTRIAGRARNRIAALDATTGAAAPGFAASASSTVHALEYAAGTVYLGGSFTFVNGVNRNKIAALDATTGDLSTAFAARANSTVRGLSVIPGTTSLAVGGSFRRLGGAARPFLGSVSRATGRVTAWRPRPDCHTCVVLDVTARSDLVFGAVAGPGGRVTAWRTAGGARAWSQRGDGDVQAVTLVDGTLFAGGHFDSRFGRRPGGSAAVRRGVAALRAGTGRLLPWAPDVTGTGGVWAVHGDGRSLWIGGSYTRVNTSPAFARVSRFRPA
jgi:hypothetical protein